MTEPEETIFEDDAGLWTITPLHVGAWEDYVTLHFYRRHPSDGELVEQSQRVGVFPRGLLADTTAVTLAEHEIALVERTIAYTKGNKSQAAQILGIDRRTLYRKLAKKAGKP